MNVKIILLTHALATVASFVDGAVGFGETLVHANAFVASHALWAGQIARAGGGNANALDFRVSGEEFGARAHLFVVDGLALRVDSARVAICAGIFTLASDANLVRMAIGVDQTRS